MYLAFVLLLGIVATLGSKAVFHSIAASYIKYALDSFTFVHAI